MAHKVSCTTSIVFLQSFYIHCSEERRGYLSEVHFGYTTPLLTCTFACKKTFGGILGHH